MARFILFAGDSFYAEGGILDFKGCFVDRALAIQAAQAAKDEWFQIVDAVTWRIVAYMSGSYCGVVDKEEAAPDAVAYYRNAEGALQPCP